MLVLPRTRTFGDVTHSLNQPTERRTLRRGGSELAGSEPAGFFEWGNLASLQLLAFETQKIATHCTDIISARADAFFRSLMQAVVKKSCLQFLIPTAVFHDDVKHILSVSLLLRRECH